MRSGVTGGKRKIRVGVILGGRSGEHEVSLVSAQSVMNAMDKDKYEVIPVGITKEGRWIAGGDPVAALKGLPAKDTHHTALLGDPTQRGLVPLDAMQAVERATPVELDVVFPVLHGPYGEDGTVQGLLELANIPYVGAGVLGSALGMDKAAMKDVFKAHGLPIVQYRVYKRLELDRNQKRVEDEIERELGYPCFVKPANLGSSVGVSKVHDRAELGPALLLAASYDRKIVVEQGINAREIECSVLGNDEPEASVLGEIIPCNEFYDYNAKYIDGRSELVIPAPLPDDLAQRIRQLAIQAFLAVDCAGMARVDFLLDRDTLDVYVNEVNTIPGFTAISMYPKLWEASGLPYPALIDRLIELALERHEEKRRTRTSYTPQAKE
ncbi:MAG: D-alanine--D-alanine ligase [Anaerolineae bacterium]|nr:D-alanine--D-alanine ligase [Anaerolineae bacterium]